jgi:DNA polymerase-3 subunit delta
VFYILHGEEEFGLGEELATLRARLAEGDEAMAQLNTTILDGHHLTLGELRHACDSIPFMADRRLVIVHGLLGRWASRDKNQGETASGREEPASKQDFFTDLAAYLPNLPPTTRLVFVESNTLKPSHPILKVSEAEGKQRRAFVRHFPKPRYDDLPGWIQNRARDKGSEINYEATRVLASLVGRDLRLLDQEIEKLLLYTDGQPVTVEDVRTLVSLAREASIFDLVDCVGRRETDRALRLLHRMLEEEAEPLYLLAMLARQVRILIQVSELQTQHLTPREMANRLKLHPYVVEKGIVQARNFDLAQLEAAHRQLVETDWKIKTGELESILALDTLVVALTHM